MAMNLILIFALRKQQYLGVTPPISLNGPNPEDLKHTEGLIAALHASGFFESEEESERREIVLGRLNLIVQKFVKKVAEVKGLPESLMREVGGKIFTFGSYRLGVHGKGADIDTLCVAPQHVDRSDFFGLFHEMLKAEPKITELTPVPDAYVPVMTMVFDEISIDLVFARLPFASIPEDLDLLDPSILKNLDEKSMLSLNGSRATDEILRLVPDVHSFHTALRCIKLWAKRRGLYNNAMGYLGGVACALLTARICQLYPNAAASTIIARFFKIYQQWSWPQPVYLKPIEDFPLNQKVWNPKLYPADRNHRMPVITPAYPSMCSTHNVTRSTLTLMTNEFTRGSEIVAKIEAGEAEWSELFTKTDFFLRHRNFFQILAVAETEEDHRMWSGYVESKVRILMNKLELEANIAVAPPCTETFDVTVQVPPFERTEENEDDEEEPTGTSTAESGEAKVNSIPFDMDRVLAAHTFATEKTSLEGETKPVYTTAYYIAIGVAPFDPNFKGPRRLVLDRPVAEFKYFVSSWEKLSPQMHLVVRDIKREALPDYVFGPEGRPAVFPVTRVKKRPAEVLEGEDDKRPKSD